MKKNLGMMLGLFFFWVLLIMISCSQVTTEDISGKEILLQVTSLPALKPLMIDGYSIFAEAIIDGDSANAFSLVVNQADNSITNQPINVKTGFRDLTLRYYIIYGPWDVKLIIAEQTKEVQVKKNSDTFIQFTSLDYSYPNTDGDGVSNIDELENSNLGSDPTSHDAIGWDHLINRRTIVPPPLTSIDVLSLDKAMAVGQGGAYLVFGGTYWRKDQSIFTDDMLDIDLVSENLGWAVGMDRQNDSGSIYKLSSGYWSPDSIPFVTNNLWFLFSVDFVSSNEGWAVGVKDTDIFYGIGEEQGVILRYLNGSWETITDPISNRGWMLYSVDFVSSNEGWAVGVDCVDNNCWNSDNRGMILHYNTGDWVEYQVPTIDSRWEINKVYFPSQSNGWAVGVDCQTGSCIDGDEQGVIIEYSSNLWTIVTPESFSESWQLYGVYFSNTTEGWAVGDDDANGEGMVLHYKNGIWTKETLPYICSDWRLTDVMFIDNMLGWAIGRDDATGSAVILKCMDGLWSEMKPKQIDSSEWILNSLYFNNPQRGWAVGRDDYNPPKFGGVFFYYDGTKWINIELPEISVGWYLESVFSIDDSVVWLAGFDYQNYKGIIYKYNTITSQWSEQSLPTISINWELKSIYFPSSLEGWATGIDWVNNEGIILKYDSGIWQHQSLSSLGITNWQLNSIFFYNDSIGWAVGTDSDNYKGIILKYEHGNWTEETISISSTDWDLKSISFSSLTEGYAVGTDYSTFTGLILKYDDITLSWQQISSPTILENITWNLKSVCATGSEQGWAVGRDYTNNSGIIVQIMGDANLFDKVYINRSDWYLKNVFCIDNMNCWFVGEGDKKGLVLKY